MMDSFDRGCDYRRLEEFLATLPDNERHVFKNQAAVHRDCTAADIAISAMRYLMLVVKELDAIKSKPPFEREEIVVAVDGAEKVGLISGGEYQVSMIEKSDMQGGWEVRPYREVSHVSRCDLADDDFRRITIGAYSVDWFRKKPQQSSGIRDAVMEIAVNQAQRLEKFEKSLVEIYQTVSSREFSTFEVLKEFDGKLKELETTVESIGRGTERHQIALEGVEYSPAKACVMNRLLQRIEHCERCIESSRTGMTASVEQDSKSSLAKAAYMRWQNGMYQSGKCAPPDWESTSISERAVWMDVVATENPAA